MRRTTQKPSLPSVVLRTREEGKSPQIKQLHAQIDEMQRTLQVVLTKVGDVKALESHGGQSTKPAQS